MDEQQIQDAIKKLSANEVVKFLDAKKAKPDCPMCGNGTWALVDHESEGVPMIPMLKDGGLQLPPPHIPSIGLICTNCAFVRFHAARQIVYWIHTEGDK